MLQINAKWIQVLREMPQLSAEDKLGYDRFIKHYIEHLRDQELPVSKASCDDFITRSTLAFSPTEERVQR